MKKVLSLLITFLFCIVSFKSYSQKNYLNYYVCPPLNRPADPGTVNCSTTLPAALCNNIANNNFTPLPTYDPYYWNHHVDPFGLHLVPNWEVSHGSPNIYDGVFYGTPSHPLPPSGTTGYFFAGVGSDNFNGWYGEGLVQKIPNLIAGHTYALSFFKGFRDYTNVPGVGTNYPLDFLRVRLMNCVDYSTMYVPNSYAYPVVPTNSQQIYCETTVSNDPNIAGWQQVFMSFTPNSNYDMIWIYPEEQNILNRTSGLYFAHPQLIDITALQNQVIQATQPNCMATLPNCGPLNSVFNWEGPNGQTLSAPAGQALQINVNNPLNVGTWALDLTMPTATITNSTCGTQSVVIGSVNINACATPIPWPKVYSTVDGLGSIRSTYNGNVIFYSTGFINLPNPFYNHIGVFPPAGQDYTASFQYNGSGSTDWISASNGPIFAFSNGIVQMNNSGGANDFYDSNTGNVVTPPVSLQQSENIIAETSSGTLITRLQLLNSSQIKIHSNVGVFSVTPSINYYHTYFNKNTNDLLLLGTGVSNGILQVYHYNGVNFDTPPVTVPNPIEVNGYVVNVDDNNIIYGIVGGVLKKYNYITNVLENVNIPGFDNQSVSFGNFGWTYSDYTSNQLILFNQNDNYIYHLKLDAINASKKINTSNIYPSVVYCIDGNNVYVAGYNYSPATIGTQNIPYFTSWGVPTFITKLNLLTDFSSFQFLTTNQKTEISFKAIVAPNPTTTKLTLRITENDKQSLAAYNLTVTDKMGGVLLRQANYTSGKGVDISRLESGLYFATIINNKNEKVTVAFSKL